MVPVHGCGPWFIKSGSAWVVQSVINGSDLK
jgi:hypothetical protein